MSVPKIDIRKYLRMTPEQMLRNPWDAHFPIGTYRGEPVTPYEIYRNNIPPAKVEPLDVRIAREAAERLIDRAASLGLIVAGSSGATGMGLTDKLAAAEVKRSRRLLGV